MANNWSAFLLIIWFGIEQSTGRNSFDWEFFKVASVQKGHENMAVSPYSVKLLLSILKEGDFDDAGLSQALGDTPIGQSTEEYFGRTLRSLQENSGSYELHVGTKLFIDEHFTPTAALLKISEKVFKTSIERVKFSKAKLKQTAEIINGWCTNITNGHIKEIVNEELITDSEGVLANAIYFKGTWKKQFNVESTTEEDFRVTFNKIVKVQSMFRSGNFDYYFSETDLNGVKVLRLPYKGDKYAMKILLPLKEDGLDNLIASINENTIKNIQENLQKTVVELRLPRFKFDTEFHLEETLKMVGIKNIFKNSVNLTGLGKRAKISHVLQKTGIVVDEKGTEIFVATIQVSSRSLVNVKYFNVNHPFAFFLEDETTGAILFAGKVVNPLGL